MAVINASALDSWLEHTRLLLDSCSSTSIVEHTRLLIDSCSSTSIVHIFREHNGVADSLSARSGGG